MKGNKLVIDHLNKILCGELTAINQYFLHARILQNWGLEAIGKKEYDASIDEMRHADELIKRILFLEGLPNVQKLHKVNIGETVKEILEADLSVEVVAIENLKEAIKDSEAHQDYTTRDLFQKILNSEESHIDWIETQLQLINKVGELNYLQSQM